MLPAVKIRPFGTGGGGGGGGSPRFSNMSAASAARVSKRLFNRTKEGPPAHLGKQGGRQQAHKQQRGHPAGELAQEHHPIDACGHNVISPGGFTRILKQDSHVSCLSVIGALWHAPRMLHLIPNLQLSCAYQGIYPNKMLLLLQARHVGRLARQCGRRAHNPVFTRAQRWCWWVASPECKRKRSAASLAKRTPGKEQVHDGCSEKQGQRDEKALESLRRDYSIVFQSGCAPLTPSRRPTPMMAPVMHWLEDVGRPYLAAETEGATWHGITGAATHKGLPCIGSQRLQLAVRKGCSCNCTCFGVGCPCLCYAAHRSGTAFKGSFQRQLSKAKRAWRHYWVRQ